MTPESWPATTHRTRKMKPPIIQTWCFLCAHCSRSSENGLFFLFLLFLSSSLLPWVIIIADPHHGQTREIRTTRLFFIFFFFNGIPLPDLLKWNQEHQLLCVFISFLKRKKNVEIKMSEMLWRTIHIRNRGGHYLWTYGRFNLSFMLADSDQTLNMGLHS